MTNQSEVKSVPGIDVALNVRSANMSDAAAIWRLVRDSKSLDTNSCYAYLLICTDFAETCLVVYDEDRLAGFVAAYVPPPRRDVVFVWQIGVDPQYRGCGLGRRLLTELINRTVTDGVRYVEATITPGNLASQRLFHSFAESREAELSTREHFGIQHFAESEHEQEILVRVGPI